MGIEPTRDLLGPTLVLKTRGTTRHQSPPRRFSLILPVTIVIHPPRPVNKSASDFHSTPFGGNWLCFFRYQHEWDQKEHEIQQNEAKTYKNEQKQAKIDTIRPFWGTNSRKEGSAGPVDESAWIEHLSIAERGRVRWIGFVFSSRW
jgi:hypothetical protein